MIWEEPEEPWTHVILFAGGRIERSRKPPGSLSPLGDASLEGKSFLSHDVQGSTAIVADPASAKLVHWSGKPLNPELQKLFDITSTVSVNISGENLKGWIFFLDKSGLTSEDLTLAEVVAGRVTATMDLCYFVERLREAAAVEERVRLSRDLHDGVLQSFTAVGLQLESALKALQDNPETVEQQLRNIQEVVFEEHGDLRALVEELRLAQFTPGEGDPNLKDLLEWLCKTMEQQWSLRVELVMDQSAVKVPATLAREIYRIVREGLVNAARHAKASAAQVKLNREDRQIRINVSDNGQGFPFYGQYDQALLTKMAAGPASLKSRVLSLGGALNVFSSDSGAQVEITLPLLTRGA
jgi:signal transduction histidine kinase